MTDTTERKTISLRNDYLARQALRRYESTLNSFQPWSGVPDVQVRFSSSPTGFTAEGFPDTILGPYDMLESAGEPGVFYFVVSSDDISSALASLVGQVVYQVVEAAYGSEYYGMTDVLPLLVIDPRPAL